jgi:hypothetical protein
MTDNFIQKYVETEAFFIENIHKLEVYINDLKVEYFQIFIFF